MNLFPFEVPALEETTLQSMLVSCEGLFWRAEIDHPRWIDNAFVSSQGCKPVLWWVD